MPKESVSPEQAGWLRRNYGIRTADGMVNGKINWGVLGRDVSRGVIVAILLTMIFGGKNLYDWYQKNKDLPVKVEQIVNDQKEINHKLDRLIGYQEGRNRR